MIPSILFQSIPDNVGELGFAGLIVFFVLATLKLYLDYMSKKKNNNYNSGDGTIRIMASQIKDLHEWHNKEDEDGVKIWYIKHSLTETIKELNNNLQAQTSVLKDLHISNVKLVESNKKLASRIDEIERNR